MSSALYRIELSLLAGIGGGFWSWPVNAARILQSGFVWLPVALLAGLGSWVLLSSYTGEMAESEPVRLIRAAATQQAAVPARDDAIRLNPAVAPADGNAPSEIAGLDGLKISSQSWRRGGLGSKALVTFTLRNSNDYAVRDIEISCAFSRRDGSHLTDRARVIHDTVDMRSRKRFAQMHIGFVNLYADKAKCSLVAASRI